MPSTQISEERDLLQRLRDGDEMAFGKLFRQYAPLVNRFVLKLLKSSELSNDITQGVFIKVWENRASLGDIRSFKSYLLTTSKNQSLNFLKRAAIDSHAKAIILHGYQAVSNQTEEAMRTAEYIEYLDRQLDLLGPQSREVFRLCRQQYKTYDEAAEILGISRNTVKKHMVKSMRILSEAVERDLGITLSALLITLYSS